MALHDEKRHDRGIDQRRDDSRNCHELLAREWPRPSGHALGRDGCDCRDELRDRLEKLPSPEQVEELFAALRVATLRELSAEIVNAGIACARNDMGQLEYVRLLNSWIATAEETVAAGRNVNRIAARRRKKS